MEKSDVTLQKDRKKYASCNERCLFKTKQCGALCNRLHERQHAQPRHCARAGAHRLGDRADVHDGRDDRVQLAGVA